MTEAFVHVIDDDSAVLDAVMFLLEAEDLPARAYNGPDAFLAVAEAARGCVVTDVRMPGMDGLQLNARLRAMGLTLPVIMMTGHADVPLAVQAMKEGVVDFIEKPFDDETLLNAIRTALAQSPEGPVMSEEQKRARERLSTLSPRELQVMQGLVDGKANKVIAYDLEISPRTVEIYRAHLMTKTGAKSLSELVKLALAAKL